MMIDPMPTPDRSMNARPAAAPDALRNAVCETELDSGHLFGRRNRLVIRHQGERYCLQVTRAGKLLLTK